MMTYFTLLAQLFASSDYYVPSSACRPAQRSTRTGGRRVGGDDSTVGDGGGDGGNYKLTPAELIDSNNNGVPDVFEQRRPISDILNDDQPRPTVVVEIETVPRRPKKGELFLCASYISEAEYDYGSPWPIVRVISGNYRDIQRIPFH